MSVRKRRKLKRGIKKLIIFLITLCCCLLGYVVFNNHNNGLEKKSISKVKNIKLSEYVKTDNEIPLYVYENGKYLEYGNVGKNIVLHMGDKTDNYYKVKDLDKEYYIKGDKISTIKNEVKYDDRYKNYIVYNNNINTKDKTSFYDSEDNLVYSINSSYSLPIIEKGEDKYGVEFGNRLLYIKSKDGEIIEKHNTDEHNISGIATLNYHAFYDDDNIEEKNSCTTEICHSDTQFKTHLDYIKEHNILTLKIEELEKYIDGKIQLPKSVLITIDDGGRTDVAVDMLTEYKMYATIFLVTGLFNPTDYYVTDYIELHSHSHNMHNVGDCPTGQGGGIQCLSEEKIQKDLKTSRDLLNNTTYFCYPFYEFNNYSIEQLKKAGFTMAFSGESSRGDNLAKVGMDKFRIPRFVIVTYTTMKDLEKYFNGMK